MVAGVAGFLLQQIRLAYLRMGDAGRPQRIVAETRRTPAEVVRGSIQAGCWLTALLIFVVVMFWLLLQAL